MTETSSIQAKPVGKPGMLQVSWWHRKLFYMNLTDLIYKICNHTFKPDWGGIQPSPKHQPNFLQVPVHITP